MTQVDINREFDYKLSISDAIILIACASFVTQDLKATIVLGSKMERIVDAASKLLDQNKVFIEEAKIGG